MRADHAHNYLLGQHPALQCIVGSRAGQACKSTVAQSGGQTLPSGKRETVKTSNRGGRWSQGIAAPVEVRRHAGARRLTLRVSKTRRAVIVTVPAACRMDEAGRFLKSHIDWVRERLGRVPEPVPFADGARIPCAATLHRICFTGPGAARPSWASKRPRAACRSLNVAGRTRACRAPAAGLAARQARNDLDERVGWHAQAAGRAGAAHRPARSDQPLGLVLGQRPAVVLLAADPGAAATCSTTSPRTRWRTWRR